MNKEHIYDSEIHPLMAKIIEICKREKLAMVASFDISTPEDDGLLCTTALLDEDFEPPRSFLQALKIIRNGGGSQTMAITVVGGEK